LIQLEHAFAMISSLPAAAREFDAIAPSWNPEHGPRSVRALEFAARIRYRRGRCPSMGNPRVLDPGCGTGQIL
jgi:hypothetical protein